jgi:CHAT domain-containing protein
LVQARSIVGRGNSEIITGAAFSDDQILAKSDISNYRILHFATHGLVTAPSPSCPAKPALLTSFGKGNSDGLLSFDEIFDLKLDADIVILSACDTAGKASIRATREAGVSSGGGTALDGLVRSFIGAGSRSVLASHWPAPDDFKATEKLIGGLFSGGKGKSVATALRNSQIKLMNDPVTSPPYYWSGFAIVGDGARPFLPDGKSADVLGSSRTGDTARSSDLGNNLD